eukprot:SAG31_NODE_14_length_37953_cov_109.719660_24_plen_267_part_00
MMYGDQDPCGGNSCFGFDMHGFDREKIEGFCDEEITEDGDTSAAELAADSSREEDGCAWNNLERVALDCDRSHGTQGVQISGVDSFCYTRCYRELFPEWSNCHAEFTAIESEALRRFVKCAAPRVMFAVESLRISQNFSESLRISQNLAGSVLFVMSNFAHACSIMTAANCPASKSPVRPPPPPVPPPPPTRDACADLAMDVMPDIEEECCGGLPCTSVPESCHPRCRELITTFYNECGQLLFATRTSFLALMQSMVGVCQASGGH